jgi:hypothetical protein
VSKLLTFLVLVAAATSASAQRCKLSIDTDDHRETRILVLFRGGTVALGGRFGVQSGEVYLRGLYNSQFRRRATFNDDTPLTVRLADGQAFDFPLASVDSSRLRFLGAALNNRTAEPVFVLSDAQLRALASTAIVSLTMRVLVEGEIRPDEREVADKHAEAIMAAVRCLAPDVARE